MPEHLRWWRRLGASAGSSRFSGYGSSLAIRIYAFAALSLLVGIMAVGSAALFARQNARSVRDLHAQAAAVDTAADLLHRDIDRVRAILLQLAENPDGAVLARDRSAVASLTGNIRDCLAGGRDCVRPPLPFAAEITVTSTALLAAQEDVLAQAARRTGDLPAARGHFNELADRLHHDLRQWQQWQFDTVLNGMMLQAMKADQAARAVMVSAAVLAALGLAGLLAVRQTLRRLGRLRTVMLELAGGEAMVEIPFRDAANEVGQIARALDVFLATRRRLTASQDELRRAKSRLDAALNNMSQGLCMFDADDRLVVANDRVLQMFGVADPSQVHARTFSEIVDFVVVDGNLAQEDAAGIKARFRTRLASGVPVAYVRDLQDGRSLAVALTPLAEGGWVATFDDITARRAAETQIAFLAHHDALTGLANRVLFELELRKAAVAAHPGDSAALLYLDLDRFKDVNDTLGHAAGDTLLRLVAARLRDVVRGDDRVARLGGDEFAVIQEGTDVPDAIGSLARRITAALTDSFEVNGHHVHIGCSIGIARMPADGTEPEELLRKADLALYHAKTEGRGTHRSYEPGMSARLQARHGMEEELHRALEDGTFELHYQPQVDLATRRVSGFEALLRWRSPARGLVLPAEFIPLAEETGLIVPIGAWVLRRACADAAAWPAALTVAVNISAVQFRSEGLLHTVQLALAETGLAPQRLDLEITESTMLTRSERTLRLLHDLRALGVHISMDDFGIGHSSLSYLHRFPFNKIKIDQSFVRGLGGQEGCEAIIRAVVGLGASLGIETVAEGIETETQFAQVRAEGCRHGQGFLFSRPIPAAEIPALLRRAEHFAQDDQPAALASD